MVSACKRKRCSVRFAPDTIVASSALRSLTEAETARAWWSERESEEFKRRARDEVSCYIMESKAKKEDRGSASDEERAEIGPSHLCLEENIGHLDDGTSRYRGLEFRASVDRMKGRLISVRAVIEVQERLRGGRVEISYDPAEIISLVYQKLCQKARKTAQQTGRSDAVQAFLACMPSSFESNPVVMMTSCNNMSKGEGQRSEQPRKRNVDDFLGCRNDYDSDSVEHRRVRMRPGTSLRAF
mmetsp:Transcript_33513/g.68455  ORF Transcript_33513/g.68455 Transcript_33513/m.68455 type:complete len:241 (-) Transcript_33513:101-823(-)